MTLESVVNRKIDKPTKQSFMQLYSKLSLIAVFAFFFSCTNANTTANNTPSTNETPQENIEVAKAEIAPAPVAPKPIEEETTNKTKETAIDKPAKPMLKEVVVDKPTAPVKVAKKIQKEEEPQITEVTIPEEEIAETPPAPAFSHKIWDEVLRKYVSSSGKVNYKGLKANRAQLDAYIDLLTQNGIQSNWSKKEKMAYWINAYNAYTVKLIVDNYPLSSITKLHGGSPWKVKLVTLGGKKYSLDQIENEILRPQYKDARIHFAVNCAAKSCPPLLNKAWTADNLNRNFEQQAKKFVNNKQFNVISANEVQISKIFEWYAVDFGNIVEYLNKYSNTKINPNAKVTYKEYDWKLNE
jgi:hypothetical protein